jgi:transcriptional regulator with XRE-family HTH domain
VLLCARNCPYNRGMNTTKIIHKVKAHNNVSELARLSGVSRRAITSIRAGHLPSIRILSKLEAALWPKKFKE